jgi:CubicO group peptidase (beta-lactamase class C family)
MSRWTTLSLISLSLFVTLSAAEDTPAWKTKANELVDPVLKSKLRNLVIGVIDSDGKRHYLTFGDKPDGFGAIDENTIFEIGSVTKVFTSLLLADAVVRGEVKLDDPVQKHLPSSLKVPKRGKVEITLEDLATHTSGLPRLPSNLAMAKGFTGTNPYARYGDDLLATALKNITLKDEQPKADYSNMGAGLLGLTLAKRAKKSYEEAMQERILGPLEMTNTTTKVKSADKSRFIPCFTGGGQPAKNWDFLDTTAGAGALRSTAADMLTFLECQAGRRETSLRKAMDLSHEPRKDFQGIMKVGLGWLTYEQGEPKRRVWWHNGGTGGFCSFAAFCKDPAVAIVILSNRSNPPETDKLGRELMRVLTTGK